MAEMDSVGSNSLGAEDNSKEIYIISSVQNRILKSMENRNIKLLREVLEEYPDRIETQVDNEGSTALMRCAYLGLHDFMEELLRKGADPIATNRNKDTSLHISCFNANSECTKVLLEKTHESKLSKLINSKNKNGCYAIHFASFVGHVESIRLILAKMPFDINVKDSFGNTPISVAALNGQESVVQFLIDKGASLFESETRYGNTVLHQAAISGSTKCLLIVLESLGNLMSMSSPQSLRENLSTDSNSSLSDSLKLSDSLILSPLSISSHSGTYHTLEGASTTTFISVSPLEHKNLAGHTPLHASILSDHPECARLLLENGAECSSEDSLGSTPLHAAAVTSLRCTQVLLDNQNEKERIKLLEKKNAEGYTPFLLALKAKKEDISKFLLDCGAVMFDGHESGSNVDLEDPRIKALASAHEISMVGIEKLIRERSQSVTAGYTEDQKSQSRLGIQLFNEKPKAGIAHFQNIGIIGKSSADIAKLLFNTNGLDKTQIGEYLGDEKNTEVLEEFVKLMNFSNLEFDIALRRFLYKFRLPGEAQKIDRFMEKFAQQYFKHNNDSGMFVDSDAVYVLAFATIMLSTDLHSHSIKKKITKQQFLNNTKTINGGGPLPKTWMTNLYEKIANEEFKMEGQAMYATAERKGWLMKQAGGQIKTWKRRWFVLDQNLLYYFNNSTDKEPSGIIPLENLKVERVEHKKRYCLEIFDPSNQEVKSCKINPDGSVVRGGHTHYYIAAANEEDAKAWHHALNCNIYQSPLYQFLKNRREKSNTNNNSNSPTTKKKRD
eukprot:TRINITY_DN5264_c0_g1_i1.p1 TRINITY_DN5264_c0_g1~~TRINITY_DN5264_c0_g1_i1.p1  ORF type:complete len:782 (+),score=223.75 TRINITY_DN5264_c0_g1_i1:110-2455(+)